MLKAVDMAALARLPAQLAQAQRCDLKHLAALDLAARDAPLATPFAGADHEQPAAVGDEAKLRSWPMNTKISTYFLSQALARERVTVC